MIKKSPNSVNEVDIENYLSHYQLNSNPKKQPRFETIKSNRNGILFYYNKILKKDF